MAFKVRNQNKEVHLVLESNWKFLWIFHSVLVRFWLLKIQSNHEFTNSFEILFTYDFIYWKFVMSVNRRCNKRNSIIIIDFQSREIFKWIRTLCSRRTFWVTLLLKVYNQWKETIKIYYKNVPELFTQ